MRGRDDGQRDYRFERANFKGLRYAPAGAFIGSKFKQHGQDEVLKKKQKLVYKKRQGEIGGEIQEITSINLLITWDGTMDGDYVV